ncbi:MAG: heme peroxidase, partial [Anaerolineae bacterium]|nr:heme peroxidase [Anaerolineae bacterium]
GGNHLGPVGGRIVGEVFLGLMRQSPYSVLNGYSPRVSLPMTDGKFTMPDLLNVAQQPSQ